MYLSIIILPLLGSIVSGFFGRKIGVTGSRILSCLSIITTTILAIISFFEVGFNNNPVSLHLFNWLDSESFNMVWNFQFDSLTVSMLIPVLIISSLVHFYSIGYMSHDPHNQRFFSYLSLFTFMMIILVTGNNYLLMFVGWEGVGVCSYLLVSFWFTRIAANQSSMAAFLTNRVGDCFLTIGMLVILWSLGNLDYSIVSSVSPYINENIITIIGLCLLIGAMAKSSQVGLHIWLPMAMEGPTPVSALIHAATMVTAGVYLLIRSSPLIEYSSTVLLICLWLGAITTIFSSLIGLFQQDIKKIIAYSTMSQLGMMVIAIGLSSYNIAIFHLINHAFYKGLLFLGAGAVIHAVMDNQDLRKYGGLISSLPLSYSVILIASLSLVALPFMTGYYSKDFILESAYGQYNFSSIDVYTIAVIGAIFTTLYSVKVIFLTFLAKPNGSINSYKNAHESDIYISLPLTILAIFSIYFGFLTKDIFIGLGSGFFTDNSIFIHPIHEILINTEFAVPTIFKLIPFIFTLSFIALAMIYSEFIPAVIYNFKTSNLGYYVFGFFNQRFLIEFFYNSFIINPVLDLGGQTTKVLDKGSVEAWGPYGINFVLTSISKTISSLSQGVVTNYALYILVGACFLIFGSALVLIFTDGINSYTMSSIFILIIASYYINSNLNKYYFNENIDINSSSYNFDEYLTAGFAFKLKKLKVLIIYIFSMCCLWFKHSYRIAKITSFKFVLLAIIRFLFIKIKGYILSPQRLSYLVLKIAIIFLTGNAVSENIHLDNGDEGDQSENMSNDNDNENDSSKEDSEDEGENSYTHSTTGNSNSTDKGKSVDHGENVPRSFNDMMTNVFQSGMWMNQFEANDPELSTEENAKIQKQLADENEEFQRQSNRLMVESMKSMNLNDNNGESSSSAEKRELEQNSLEKNKKIRLMTENSSTNTNSSTNLNSSDNSQIQFPRAEIGVRTTDDTPNLPNPNLNYGKESDLDIDSNSHSEESNSSDSDDSGNNDSQGSSNEKE